VLNGLIKHFADFISEFLFQINMIIFLLKKKIPGRFQNNQNTLYKAWTMISYNE
jgi:hypothetical protein